MQSDEELKGKLQTFPDVYKHNIGEDLDPKEIESYLTKLISERKERFIRAAFDSFTVPQARRFIEMLKSSTEPKKTKDNRKNLSKQSKE